MSQFSLILDIIGLFCCCLNIVISIVNKNTHAFIGWCCATLYCATLILAVFVHP